jgi:acylphosphatase
MTTERIQYRGRVQGVGFRYTVRTIANHHPVAGYVKNLPDGTVEVVAQGEREAINSFRAEIAAAVRGNIVDCVRDEIDGTEVFHEFEIRY